MQRSTTSLVVAVLLLSTARVSAQVTEIIDRAGDGLGNLLGDPRGLALGQDGTVYVAGMSSHNVFEITATGLVSEIIDGAGDGFWSHLDGPRAVAIDRTGNVYVAGSLSDNVFQITPEGVKTAIIGASGDGRGNPLDEPRDVAVDTAGNVYVVGASSDNVFKITPDGVRTQILDASGDGRGHPLDEPRSVTVDSSGNVYVAGGGSDNVIVITRAGGKAEIIGSAGDGRGKRLGGPIDVAVDSSGNVYVAGATSDNVFKITPAGVRTEIIGPEGDGRGNPLDGPRGLALDSAGNVYVAGRNSDQVFRITPRGDRTTIVGGLGDVPLVPLDEPRGLAADSAGKVFVSGGSSHNVLEITPAEADLVDGGFEGGDPGAMPASFGVWGHDHASVVAAENGVRPAEGDRMLEFLSTSPVGRPGAGGACDVIQLIRIPPEALGLGGKIVASARFNRVNLDAETDRAFGIRVRAYVGSPGEFPARHDEFLAGATTHIETDDDPRTWETATVELEIPDDADYLCVWIFAREDVVDDEEGPEFDGHYADGVTLRFSTSEVGSGGSGEVSFRRGDCNDDGAVDISDALFTLRALFLGGARPACDDACDSNDDGAIDISDASATLGVLFLGSGSIPPPGMTDCGVDPTEDAISCGAFSACDGVCGSEPPEVGPVEEGRSVGEKLEELLETMEIPSALAGAFFRLARAHASGRAPANDLETFAFGVFSDLSEPTRAALTCATDHLSQLTSTEQVRLFGEVVTFSDSVPLTRSDLALFVAQELDQRLSLAAFGESDPSACLDTERPGLPRPTTCFDVDRNFPGFCPVICRLQTSSMSQEVRTAGHVPPLSAGELRLHEVEQTCTFDADNNPNCDPVVPPDCTGESIDGVCLQVPIVEHGDTIRLEGYNFFDVDAVATLRSLWPLDVYREVDAWVCGDVDTPPDAPLDCEIEDIITFTIPEDLPEGLYRVGVSVPNNTGDPVHDQPWYSTSGPVIRVVPPRSSSFQLTVEDLHVADETGWDWWGSDELGLRLLTVPIAADGSVGMLNIVAPDLIGDLDTGNRRQLDRVLFSGPIDAGLGLSIVGWEVDDRAAYEREVSDFMDAYGLVLESNWSQIADAFGSAAGAGAAAAGYGAFSQAASEIGSSGFLVVAALVVTSELIIEDEVGLPFAHLAELTSLNFPNPPVVERTSARGIDITAAPCQDTVDEDIPGCSEFAKAPFQYTERRTYASDQHGSRYHLTFQYTRVR